MAELYTNEPMLDIYIFETTQNISQLETSILDSERSSCYTPDAINEIFRIMHTIKGSSAMMLFDNISSLAHSMEDLFYYIREQKPINVNCATLSDLVLEGVDFIKVELQKIKAQDCADGDPSNLIESIKEFLFLLKHSNPLEVEIETKNVDSYQQYYITHIKTPSTSSKNAYKADIFFEDGCEMENIRAYTLIQDLKEITEEVFYLPEDIMDNDDTIQVIRKEGFKIFVKADKAYDEMHEFFNNTVFLKGFELIQLENDEDFNQFHTLTNLRLEKDSIKIPRVRGQEESESVEKEAQTSAIQSIISVNVSKLDKLMDLVGEMVIAEAMVTQNPDLKNLNLDNFNKAARQLHKITAELQDTVMSIRMVPLSTTFLKMHRVMRDMCKKLGKEVQLELIGEETEVDKNIIEHISDPLMHLLRNSIDHGIEEMEYREQAGKPKFGKVTLEAKNSGSDVLVIVRDDGKGLNKEKILQKARINNLLSKPESEMIEREIYNLIFLPGFSTKENVTEFSGRGVGMDVVIKNLEVIGGSVAIESIEGVGTSFTMKIPLTLAIIDGMNIGVGKSRFTLPTVVIKESFRPKVNDTIRDPDGNEMIMVRGRCYPILRLHEHYGVHTKTIDFTEGILIMVEQDDRTICIFADELIGQQQVVVKSLPNYIKNIKKIEGLAGCTLLGDGSISLILDISGLTSRSN